MKKRFLFAKLHRIGGILWRIRRGIDKMVIHICLPFIVKQKTDLLQLQRFGSDYGGWTIPVKLLDENSIAYCVGVGVDATFDFTLVKEFGCNVFSFDPTPKAINYMDKAEYDRSKLKFLPIGVWNEDTELRFYSPANSAETSHSVFDLQGTGKYFTAKCHKLSTIMNELGHDHIDLLKLDIEGAWCNVVQNIVDEQIDITVLCVELDSPTTLFRVLKVKRMLSSIGFELVHYEKDNYLFIQKSLLTKINSND